MDNVLEYYLQIADLNYRVGSRSEDLQLHVFDSYSEYICAPVEKADIEIEVYRGIPEKFNTGEKIFDSSCMYGICDEFPINSGWDIYSFDGERAIVISSVTNPGKKQRLALFSPDCKKWNIYYHAGNEPNIVDVFSYPMGAIINYYVTMAHKGIVLHASAIMDKDKGYVFAGVSGKGKTTMAVLWQKEGQIINDERVVIRKSGGKSTIYNTPYYKNDSYVKSELTSFFLLNHAKENVCKKLSGANAMTRLMASCVQHSYDKELINTQITNLIEILEDVPVYELGFVPDKSIIDFIRTNC